MSRPELTVVSTLYCSAPFLDEFVRRITAAALSITGDFEIVLVNDGSPDDSLEKAIAHAKRDSRIRIIELARNFGHHAAILTGLEYAQGRRVFLVDSDLEEEPELLLKFWHEMNRSDIDVVYGVHDQKTGSMFRQITSGSFWRLFNILSETKTEENICHVRLMKRIYLDALLSLK